MDIKVSSAYGSGAASQGLLLYFKAFYKYLFSSGEELKLMRLNLSQLYPQSVRSVTYAQVALAIDTSFSTSLLSVSTLKRDLPIP